METKHLKAYPNRVCLTCGIRHGFRATEDKAFWEEGECGCCGSKQVQVTHPSAFGHLRGSWNYKATQAFEQNTRARATNLASTTTAKKAEIIPFKGPKVVRPGDFVPAG